MTNREKKRTYLKYIPPTDISDIFYNKPKPAPLIIDVSGLHWPHYDISCVLVKPDISGHYHWPHYDISCILVKPDISGHHHWPHYDISGVLVKPDISGHYCKPDMVTPYDISFTKIEIKKKSKSFFNR